MTQKDGSTHNYTTQNTDAFGRGSDHPDFHTQKADSAHSLEGCAAGPNGFCNDSEHQAARLEAARAERDQLRGWLALVAKAQHQLLDAVKLEMSDQEWQDFADALGIETGNTRSPQEEKDE